MGATVYTAKTRRTKCQNPQVWDYLSELGIRHVAIVGAHSNACILGRTMGARGLKALGLDVAVVSDMVDVLYDSRRWRLCEFIALSFGVLLTHSTALPSSVEDARVN